MIHSLPSILKIAVFVLVGVLFRKTGLLGRREIDGVRKLFLYLGLPSVLFLSFSKLDINPAFIPVILGIFLINFILFFIGTFINRLSGRRTRIYGIYGSNMNFGLLGVILYQSFYGLDHLHHFTMLGIGNEVFIWFVLIGMIDWYLGGSKKEETRSDILRGIRSFFSSPAAWGILGGCLMSVLGIDISVSDRLAVQGIFLTVSGAAAIAAPLVLIYVGFSIQLTLSGFLKSIRLILFKLIGCLSVGYLIKFLLLDRFIAPSPYYEAAFFLLVILPPIYSLTALTGEHCSEDELGLLSVSGVIHTLVTIVLFSIYTLVFPLSGV